MYKLAGSTVAKKTERPERTDKPELISVKIHADVYRLVRTAAAWKGQNIADYLSELARPGAERDCSRINKADA